MCESNHDNELYHAMRDFALRVLKGTESLEELKVLPKILELLLQERQGLPDTSDMDVDKIAEKLAKEGKPFLDRLFDHPSES